MNTSFDFANQLSDNMHIYVCKFFDELMVLYHLVGVRDNTSISIHDDNSGVTFDIRMNSTQEANELYSSFNNTDFIVYGIKFTISMNVNENIVSTVISKANY